MSNMNNPMMSNMNNPMMGNMNNQMMGNMNPMMGNMNNQMMGNMNNQMMGNMNNPMMGNINPMMGNINPMMGNINPMMGNINPMMNINPLLMNNQAFMNNINNQMMMNQIGAMGSVPMQTMADNQSNLMGNMASITENQNNNCISQNEEMSLQFCNTALENKTITVQCLKNSKLKDVVAGYWSKIGVKNPPQARYIFNARDLNLESTVSQALLNNYCIIQVVPTEGIRGA